MNALWTKQPIGSLSPSLKTKASFKSPALVEPPDSGEEHKVTRTHTLALHGGKQKRSLGGSENALVCAASSFTELVLLIMLLCGSG